MNAPPINWPLRCGRAEGALEVVSKQLTEAISVIATLRAELREVRGTLGDLRDAVDEAGVTDAVEQALRDARSEPGPDMTPREVYGVGR